MTLGEGIMAAAVSALGTWLISSFTKVSKAEHREAQQQHKELLVRVDALERDMSSRMTRTDFDKAFGKVEDLVRDFRNEARAEFKELKIELKSKT